MQRFFDAVAKVEKPSEAPSLPDKEDQGIDRGFDQPVDSVVLVVDDDQHLRRALCEHLKRNAFRAIGAGTAAEAYTQVLDLRGHLCALITDMVIPGGGGWELVQRTRHIVPQVVVVFISGAIEEQVVRSASSHPNTGFLQKPFEFSSLTRLLSSLLSAQANERGRRRSEHPIGANKKAG